MLPCMGWFALCCWKEPLAETAPAGPAPVVLTEGRSLGKGVLQPPELHLMSMSHQILSLWVFPVWTRGSAEHSTEAFGPQGGSVLVI